MASQGGHPGVELSGGGDEESPRTRQEVLLDGAQVAATPGTPRLRQPGPPSSPHPPPAMSPPSDSAPTAAQWDPPGCASPRLRPPGPPTALSKLGQISLKEQGCRGAGAPARDGDPGCTGCFEGRAGCRPWAPSYSAVPAVLGPRHPGWLSPGREHALSPSGTLQPCGWPVKPRL